MEQRNVTWGKVMQSLISNQQNLVVYSEFYRKPMDKSKNKANVAPLASSCSYPGSYIPNKL